MALVLALHPLDTPEPGALSMGTERRRCGCLHFTRHAPWPMMMMRFRAVRENDMAMKEVNALRRDLEALQANTARAAAMGVDVAEGGNVSAWHASSCDDG